MSFVGNSLALAGLDDVIRDMASGGNGLLLSLPFGARLRKTVGSNLVKGDLSGGVRTLLVGDAIRIGHEIFYIVSIDGPTTMTVDRAATATERDFAYIDPAIMSSVNNGAGRAISTMTPAGLLTVPSISTVSVTGVETMDLGTLLTVPSISADSITGVETLNLGTLLTVPSISTGSITGISTMSLTGAFDADTITVTGTSSLNGGASTTALVVTDTLTVTGASSLNGGASTTTLTVTDTTQSTDTTTGALIVSGGTAIQKNLNVAGAIETDTSLTATGVSSLNGGTSTTNLTVSGTITMSSTTAIVRGGDTYPIASSMPTRYILADTPFFSFGDLRENTVMIFDQGADDIRPTASASDLVDGSNVVGDCYTFFVININSTYTLTITAGTDVTLYGVMVVSTNTSAMFKLRVDSVAPDNCSLYRCT